MKTLRLIGLFGLAAAFGFLTACEVSMPSVSMSKITTTKAPLISHAHYGHALTAWFDTPDQKGLFVVAEDNAAMIAENAILLNEDFENWSDAKKLEIRANIISLIGNAEEPDESRYSLLRALNEAYRHMEFAATTEDTSINMKKGAAEFHENMQAIIIRADLLRDLIAA